VFNAENLTTAGIEANNPLYLAGVGYAAAGAGVTQPFVINGYATVDARAGYDSGRGWRVMVWAKNIFNKYYWTNVISSTDSAARLAGMPATYGVTFGFTFSEAARPGFLRKAGPKPCGHHDKAPASA
jgi:outer membrane receptor protein involved in Fe transport